MVWGEVGGEGGIGNERKKLKDQVKLCGGVTEQHTLW